MKTVAEQQQMKRVIELIRVSTQAQADHDRASIPGQRAVNRRTAQQYDLEIVASVEMTDVSGTAVLQAPEMQSLLSMMESPDISGVVAREFSRLMRPERFADFALLQVFQDTYCVLYLPEGPVDFNSKNGRLLGGFRALMAGQERSENLERIWSSKEQKRRAGELAQSSVVLPFGIAYEEGRGFYYKPEVAEKVLEAFRMVLSGDPNYNKVAAMLGVTPRGAHTILRNHIWHGWRIIDMKRDLSSTGKYSSQNGRQTDRRKIKRSEDEIIRVQVIREPLISDTDFAAAQQIMDRKQARHWRTRNNYAHRFTYNGLLHCAACGEPIHTAHQRADVYVCRARRLNHTCKTSYMQRVRLEPLLDTLFTNQLTDRKFLAEVVTAMVKRSTDNSCEANIGRLKNQLLRLEAKRSRVLDMFADGTITTEERKQRLAVIAVDVTSTQAALDHQAAPTIPTTTELAKALAPLAEFPYFNREQKRRLLLTLIPEIRVADYCVESVGLAYAAVNCARRGRGSSPPPA